AGSADHLQQRLQRGDDLALNHSGEDPSAPETTSNPEALMGEHSHSAQNGSSRTSASTSALRRNRSRASPFCPCFSPTMSSSDTDDEEVPEHVGRHWSNSIAEVLRQRLAIVGEAANQLAGPTVSRRMLLNDEAPAVHRIVEYSHHLVPDIDRILNSSYYWGVMDRFKAEELLDGKPEGESGKHQTVHFFSVTALKLNISSLFPSDDIRGHCMQESSRLILHCHVEFCDSAQEPRIQANASCA
ncbi:unnamed protein product, partial [Cylicostephanus goldi]